MRIFKCGDKRLWIIGNKPYPILLLDGVRCIEGRGLYKIDYTRTSINIYFSSTPEVEEAEQFFSRKEYKIVGRKYSNRKIQKMFYPKEFLSLFNFLELFDKRDCLGLKWKNTFSSDFTEFMKKFGYKTYWIFEENHDINIIK